MDTITVIQESQPTKKVDISLRQLIDIDETGGVTAGTVTAEGNIYNNQILTAYAEKIDVNGTLGKVKVFRFKNLASLMSGGTGIAISTDKDGITSITNTGVTKIIAGTNISISPVTGVGNVTITNTASSSLAVSTTPITGGTVGRVLFQGAGDVLQQSGNLFWDNTNSRLGIGTATPTTGLTVSKALTTTGNELLNITYTHSSYSSGQIQLGQYFNNTRINFIHGANNSAMYLGGANFTIETQNVGNFILSNGTERMRMVATTGNILIGTTTDAGFKLDVNGTARVVNKLSVGTPSAASALMEVTSTTLGFLPPRMTTTQKNAIASPAAGLIVFDTTLVKLCVHNGTTWETITSL